MYLFVLCSKLSVLHVFQIFSESDRDTILELSRLVSIGLIALAFAAGLFYFAGVRTTILEEGNTCRLK